MAKIKALRVTARRSGFRRAGLTHPAHPVLHPLEELTEAQIALLKDEPMLVVQEVEIEAPDEADEEESDSGRKEVESRTSPAPRKAARSAPATAAKAAPAAKAKTPAKAEAAATEAVEGKD